MTQLFSLVPPATYFSQRKIPDYMYSSCCSSFSACLDCMLLAPLGLELFLHSSHFSYMFLTLQAPSGIAFTE